FYIYKGKYEGYSHTYTYIYKDQSQSQRYILYNSYGSCTPLKGRQSLFKGRALTDSSSHIYHLFPFFHVLTGFILIELMISMIAVIIHMRIIFTTHGLRIIFVP